MKSVLFYLFGGSLMSIVAMILGAVLSSKKAKKWGERVGKILTRFARLKVGKKVWEKIEDKFTNFFIEFAKGLKSGADSDDKTEYDFEKEKKE
jgi:hypothetical protein